MHLVMKQRLKKSIFLLAAFASLSMGCGGGSGGGKDSGDNNDPGPVPINAGGSQAVLGPLSGAIITAYRLSDLSNPIEGPISAKETRTDLSVAGSFDLHLDGIPDAEWILVAAQGGEDIDANDDGIADTSPTNHLGTVHALAKAEDWRRGGKINVLTDIAWRQVQSHVQAGNSEDLENRLKWIATSLIAEDLDGDEEIDYRDLLTLTPAARTQQSRLLTPYEDFLQDTLTGSSLIGRYHAGDDYAIQEWVNGYFGDQLRFPDPIETVSVSSVVDLPANTDGIQPADIEVTSVLGGEIATNPGSSTLMLGQSATGDLALLSYATAGDAETGAVSLSVETTAKALVMIGAGVGGKPQAQVSLAPYIEDHPDFAALVGQMSDAMRTNPFLISDLDQYPDIVTTIRTIIEDIRQEYADQLLNPPLVLASSAAPWPGVVGRAATAANWPIVEDNFWKVWPMSSPWHEKQPWNWYGDAKNLDAFKPDAFWEQAVSVAVPGFLIADGYVELLPDFANPPFLATTQKQFDGEFYIATANPGAMNYAIELYGSNGELLEWYVVPRNGTVIQKLLNSGAAYREFAIDERYEFNSKVKLVKFIKYVKSADFSTEQSKILHALNYFHTLVSAINLFSDVSAVNDALQKVTQSKASLKVLTSCYTDIALSVTDDLVNSPDLFEKSKVDWFKSIFASGVPTGAIECIDDLAKGVGYVAGKTLLKAKLDAVATVLSGGGKIAFDAANDAVPVATSLLFQNEEVNYFLQIDGNGNIGNITKYAPPQPFFVCEPIPANLRGISCDASKSRIDPSSGNVIYTWDMGDGAAPRSGVDINYTYGQAGDYKIVLTITDEKGISSTSIPYQVKIGNGSKPVVNDLRAWKSASDPYRVTLAADISDVDGDLKEFLWYNDVSDYLAGRGPAKKTIAGDFGAMTVELIYKDDFPYRPTLVATDNVGNKSDPRSSVVVIGDAAAIQVFSPQVVSPQGGETVQVSGSNLDKIRSLYLAQGSIRKAVSVEANQGGTSATFVMPAMSVLGAIDVEYYVDISTGPDSMRTRKVILSGALAAANPGEVRRGLIAHYPFEGNAKDASGFGRNGLEKGGVSYAPGVIGSAAVFNGVDGWISFEQLLPSEFSAKDLTVAGWFKINSGASGNQALIQNSDGSRWGLEQYTLLILTDGRFGGEYRAKYPSKVELYGSATVRDGSWHHFALSRDTEKKVAKLYVDGSLIKQSSDVNSELAIVPQSFMMIGRRIYEPTQENVFFHGFIDELRIYNLALTDEEVRSLANK